MSGESHLRPKPMVDIGDKPILWHIMKIHAAHGLNDLVSCLGYRGYVIKEYVANDRLHSGAAVTFDHATGDTIYEQGGCFVLSPDVLDRIEGDATVWEKEPLQRLAGPPRACPRGDSDQDARMRSARRPGATRASAAHRRGARCVST